MAVAAQYKAAKNNPCTSQTARAQALRLVGQVKGQRRPIADTLYGDAAYSALASRDRAFVRALVTQFFRHHHALDAAFAPYLARGLAALSPAALGPLRLGTVELLAMDGGAPHATLNETVALAPKSLRPLVNAVLRKMLADIDGAQARFAAALAVPPWLLDAWTAAFGPHRAQEIAAGLRELPALDLSLKPGAALPQGGLRLLPHHCRLPVGDPRQIDSFVAGDAWVQDVAASLPVRLAGQVTGVSALDVCAAPGGKTLQLAAAGARVTALDISARRLDRLQENLERTALTAHLICADALDFSPSEPFDLVVLDAPCSASGTLRRHPEWPWIHARKGQLAQVPLQAALLRRALAWVKPGGQVIYAVCSLFPEEGEQQIETLLRDVPQVQLVHAPASARLPQTWVSTKGWLRTTPNLKVNMDGFFAAVLRKL